MDLLQELENETDAEVHFDEIHRRIYSVDASIFEIEPIGVVLPKSKQDLLKVLHIAKKYNIAVIARGAATGITGGCLGKALIIDLSKYFTGILEINIEKEYVRVESGVVQDQLNDALAPFDYRLGPDTSTGNRATIGGMMANNSAGARSLFYGKMSDHVEKIEMALATGEFIIFQALTEKELQQKLELNTIEGTIYRETVRILQEYKQDIKTHFPQIPRRVSGYNLDLLNAQSLNLCKLITGSEGTLGIATEITLKICKRQKQVGLCVISFHKMMEGMKAIPFLLNFKPIALEMIDDTILNSTNQLPFIIDTPKMIFVAEFAAETLEALQEKLQHFQASLIQNSIGYAHTCMTEKPLMEAVWNVRKSGLGILLSKKSYSRAIAFIEDLSIPPEKLSDFMSKFEDYLEKIGKKAGIYGHVGSGCMHIRPYIDLRQREEVEKLQQIMLDVADLVRSQGGALSGEHGDGLIRSWLTEKMFGKRLTEAFILIKKAFDPENRMNPGKIVPSPLPLNALRIDPETRVSKIETFLDFEKEGGFNLAVDLCNGNGLCRKKEGIMCPSFQASLDEYDTTRARAQSLRAIVNGKSPKESLTSDEIYDVLDLCLECKGCKTECPSQVDMAKIKAELLFQRQEKYGAPLRNRLFAHIGFINWLSAPFASSFNYLSDTFVVKKLLEMVEITKKRPLPKLTNKRFSTWFKNYTQQIQPQAPKVVLFNDTFNEFNEPNIGISAVKVLNHFGFEVIVPPWKCCGRPMISKGLLKQAKKHATSLSLQLLPYAKLGIPIIGLEPSCILTIKDDFEALLHKKQPELIQSIITFDEFMNKVIDQPLNGIFKTILVHGHCHQKSLIGMKPTLELLKKLKNLNFKEIDSGCCGMAGSFGYEKEHYDFSMKIANLKLFPAIDKADNETLIAANGFSCRTQILHGTGKRALHLAEILLQYIGLA